MKITDIRKLASVVALAGALLSTAALAQEASTARDVTFKQVAPDLYFLFEFTSSNAVVLTTTDGVLVIDTRQHPRDGQDLLERIRKLTDKPVRWVINSHFHGDHHFGKDPFKEDGATFEEQSETARIMDKVKPPITLLNCSRMRWRGASISSKAAATIPPRSASCCPTLLSTAR